MRFVLLLLLCGFIYPSLATTEIIMGYRTTEKMPYIHAEPSDDGFYFELYDEAAKRIGAKLKVVRLPKLRVLLALEAGEIDFYPGFAFDLERAKYAYWVPNGTYQRDVAVTLKGRPLMTQATSLDGFTQLVALGNPDYLVGRDTSKMNQFTVSELDVGRGMTFLRRGRADFYVYEEDTIRYYLKTEGLNDMMIHPQFVDRSTPSWAGFSRNSALFQGQENPAYDPNLPLAWNNMPMELVPGSVIDEFRQALQQMEMEGWTQALYRKYFE
ncbi:transporter substrate-binding domain-containing protein [Vibrio vulnificus]|uniref:substrate-binding periplasmic protein n=1 Tax=Vibrio vulnificus TaxID=672 RepID=UPI001A18EDF4|nr:transporter substrate-binding domain-containing protein [Vibrio vulnificus]EGR0100155.1 transporter substrate-binding domain-containing protein [Vibrio vulnificus]EKS7721384.1 transporter substrate-binding domain-containing protein [Vibrio vulnificus]ELM6616492.1 transporter substrate-binding domain-containing protein [Vibrio vulnificus]ELP3503683.1 transporter substrate-binding domain-containing protein [Vibrio vulnificus]ELP3552694.1 transporter substrate-binding domain-containing protein